MLPLWINISICAFRGQEVAIYAVFLNSFQHGD